jgi:hypothetical protein
MPPTAELGIVIAVSAGTAAAITGVIIYWLHSRGQRPKGPQ